VYCLQEPINYFSFNKKVMETTSPSLFSLTIDPLAKTQLMETAKWARFLAIFGMVVLALVLMAAVMGSALLTAFRYPMGDDDLAASGFANMARVGMIASAIVMTAIAFFPLLFLLRFANYMRSAITANDQNKLNTSFHNLKKYFRFLGIIAIIFLVFYGLIFAIALAGISTH
jgi:uncharacterized membrane protein YjgN (DUF898 family)